MARARLILVVGLATAGGVSLAVGRSALAQDKKAAATVDLAAVTSLGLKFQQIRKDPKTPAFESWGGPKHEVMNALLAAITSDVKVWDREKLTKLLGEPDAPLSPHDGGDVDDSGHERPGSSGTRAAATAKLELIYDWRGKHDALIFELDKEGRLVHAGWWFAGD